MRALRLAVALAAAAALAVPSAASAGVHRFEGNCLATGHATFAPAVRLLPAFGSTWLSAEGTCRGRLDGAPVAGIGVALDAAVQGTQSCFVPNDTTGTGTLTFHTGAPAEPVIHVSLRLPLHPTTVLVTGDAGGRALAAAVFTGTTELLTDCATTGVTGVTYAIAVQTLLGPLAG
jgi:hypothetical protein